MIGSMIVRARNANAVCVFEAACRRNRRGAWNTISPRMADIRFHSGQRSMLINISRCHFFLTLTWLTLTVLVERRSLG